MNENEQEVDIEAIGKIDTRADPQKAASVQTLLVDIFCENSGHFRPNERIISSYLGVIHRKFTIWDDEKEPVVI